MLTPPEVDARLREIAALDLDIEARGARMARRLERIKAEAAEEIGPLRRRRPGFKPAGSPEGMGGPAATTARPYRFCSCGEPMFRNADGSWQCRECDF